MKPAVKGKSGGLASSGVETLIERLREQGVEAGRKEARRIEAEARTRALEIEKAAEEKARQIVEQAVSRADAIKTGGKDALKVAMRDTVLALRTALVETVKPAVVNVAVTSKSGSISSTRSSSRMRPPGRRSAGGMTMPAKASPKQAPASPRRAMPSSRPRQ